MASAIGDLVVGLGCDNQQFVQALNTSGASLEEFAGRAEGAETAIAEVGERGGESIEGLRRGGFAFRELGRSAKEMGEHVGGANTAMGQFSGTLGSAAGGVGEAVMTYHALTEAIELATAAQAIFNAISPAGWALIAAGAIAATYAYLSFSDSAKKAEEEEKKRAETQKEAIHETDSAIAELQKEVDKLNKTPLERLQEELKKTGKSAEAIAEATKKFQELSAAKDAALGKKEAESDIKAAEKALADKERELAEMGLSGGEKFAAEFSAAHPHATAAEKGMASDLGQQEDIRKQQAAAEKKFSEERETETKKVQALAASLTEGPMDDLIKQAKVLKEGLASGEIDQATYQNAISKLQEKAKAESKPEKPEAPQAIEYGTAAAFEAIYKAANPDQDHAAQTAANTEKMRELLQVIADKPGSQLEIKE